MPVNHANSANARGRISRQGVALGRRAPRNAGWRCWRAFTLIEVILALVVLGAALAIFGEVMQLANRAAVDARAETQAQLLANSLMDEVLAGVIADTPATRQPLDVADDTPWVYSLTIGTSDVQDVVPVEIVVEQDLEPQFNPVKFRLVRWVSTLKETTAEESSGGQQGSQRSGPSNGAGSASGASPAGGAGRAGTTL